MSAERSAPSDRRVWLGEGPEQCTFCLDGYSVEVEVHCVFCDRPGCLHCMVRVRESRTLACPECAPGRDGADDRGVD